MSTCAVTSCINLVRQLSQEFIILLNCSRRTFHSRSFSEDQIQFCAQLLKLGRDVCGKASIPCPTMSSQLGFVSHKFYQDTRLYHGSSTSGHKNPASTSQLTTRKPLDLRFDRPKTGVQWICVLHTTFQSVDRDFPPSCANKGH